MLENQYHVLLAFVEEQDRRLETISREFPVVPTAVRSLFELPGRPEVDPAKWKAEAHLRKELGRDFHAVRTAVQEVITSTLRASSVVENLHSRLRNYFFLRNSLGPEYLDLLRYFFNHRRFTASECPQRQGKSPAELLSGKTHPHWLEMLGFTRIANLPRAHAA